LTLACELKKAFFLLETVHAGHEFRTAFTFHQTRSPGFGMLETVDIMPKVFAKFFDRHPFRLDSA
jgi:hypothetical protein